MKKPILAAVALASVFALSACAGGTSGSGSSNAAGKDGVTTVKVAAVGIMSDVTLDIAKEQGFFADENIDIDITKVAAPPAGLAALQGGQVDIAFSPGVVFVNARSQNVPVVIVAGASGFPADVPKGPELDKYDDTGVYVRPDSGITDLKQLEGKSIAINARKANLEATTSKALLDAGVDPKSINWVALDFTSMVEALKSGKVDAAVPVNPFTLRAEDEGMVRIASPATSFFGAGASSFWLTSENTSKQKKDVVDAFQRAIHKANKYANDHLDESIAAGVKIAGLDIPVEKAGKIYWPLKVEQSDIDNINESLVKIGFLEKPANLKNAILPGA